MLSRRAKESIKTALAMTIAYGIALHLDWDNAKWAGFAVAFVSLANIGQSLNKIALRVVGTVVGVVAALTLIAWFGQARWPFILFLAAWIGVCTYMMAGARNQYRWHVAGFVTVVVAFSGGPDPENAFYTAALRAQQNGLGILVYCLVAVFLWPVTSGSAFRKAAANWSGLQQRLLDACTRLCLGEGDIRDVRKLAAEEEQAAAGYAPLALAAETDDYEVREQRHLWRRQQRLRTELAGTLRHWHGSLAEVQALDLPLLLPGLLEFLEELDARLTAVDRMQAGDSPGHRPMTPELGIDRAAAGELSSFELSGLAFTRSHLTRLDSLTRQLFDCVAGIAGLSEAPLDVPRREPASPDFVLDPDRAAAAIRQMVTLSLAYLAYLYVDALPSANTLMIFSVAIGMILSVTPQLPVRKLYAPVATGIAVAVPVNFFVMPHLTTFAELGLVIFMLTFVICYRYAEPQQLLGRAFGLAMFVAISSIDNQQHYSFVGVVDVLLIMSIFFLILGITAYVPHSPLPEKAFQRLLRRYFRSCERLLIRNATPASLTSSGSARRRDAFHWREVTTLPDKLAAWAQFIDPTAVPGTPPERIQALVGRLRALSDRLQDLLAARDLPQSAALKSTMSDDIRAWHRGVQSGLRNLALDATAGDSRRYRARVDEIVKHMETRAMAAVNDAAEGAISDEEAENFLRLLGAYKGVSEALVEYVDLAGAVDWVPWREERFA